MQMMGFPAENRWCEEITSVRGGFFCGELINEGLGAGWQDFYFVVESVLMLKWMRNKLFYNVD